MGKDPVHAWAGDLHPPHFSLDSAHHAEVPRMATAIKMLDCGMTRVGEERAVTPATARMAQSCSLRAFFRLRLRASASFTRFFSPGFR